MENLQRYLIYKVKNIPLTAPAVHNNHSFRHAANSGDVFFS